MKDTMGVSPLAVLIEERKNKAIETLSVQFSRNALPLEEYERLVEYINRVESERELAIIEKLVDDTVLYAGKNREQDREAPSMVRDALGKTCFSLLATRETDGELLRDNETFVSLLGTNLIDIREGDLPPGRTEIDAVSILGEVRILVPPEVSVRMNAFPVMGECRIGRGVETQRSPGGPELVISGCALLGSITVKLRKDKRR